MNVSQQQPIDPEGTNPRSSDRHWALITGASSGIGMELAKVHAAAGGNLILVARRREQLDALAGQLSSEHPIEAHAVDWDLAQPGAATRLYREVQQRGWRVDYLMNNAGFGGHGKFHQSEWNRYRDMIQLNVVSLTELTHCFLPGWVERGSGRIMNVASVAAFLPGPLQAVYYATKAYVLSLSEAISNELEGTGVTVTALCPGPTVTEFVETAAADGVKAFRNAASAADVARYGYRAMLRGQVVAVHGWANKIAAHGLLPVLPRSWVRRISRRTMEKE